MIYIITWFVGTFVSVPCPDIDSKYGCLVNHGIRDWEQKQQIFFDRDSTFALQELLLKNRMWVKDIQIDSAEVRE